MRASEERAPRTIGRYLLEEEIAAGGMATVHLGRMTGGGGFARTVAIKRLHPHIAKDPDLRSMLLDEARIVSRIQHTHVVQTLDLVTSDDEVLLVMEYVHGEALHRLARAALKRGQRIPPALVVTILAQALYGLHAAHEATDERGHLLEVVHRDVSPQNILVGADGVARVLDFGVAKARGRLQSTQDGALKGKLSYMPPEQFRESLVDRRADIYAASVVLWEMLTGRELWSGPNEAATIGRILAGGAPPPGALVPGLPPALDAIVLRGLSSDPSARFSTALEMAEALHRVGFATAGEIAAFVRDVAGPSLEQRASLIRSIEGRASRDATSTSSAAPQGPTPPLSPSPQTAPPQRGPLETAPLLPGGSAAAQRTDVIARDASPPAMATAHTVRRAPPELTAARRVLVMVAAVIVIGSALLGWLLGRGDHFNETAAASASIAAPLIVSSSATIAISPSAPPAASSASPPAASSASPPAASSASTTSARPVKPRKPGVSCTPPYTVDADGIRTPKPECL